MLQKRPIRSFLCFTIGSRSTHVILAFARLTAVKIAEWLRARRKKETARLEGYKASVAPFCGLFSLHKKSPKMDDYHLKLSLVPRAGLEPARAIAHQILSLARLPIPPPRHKRTLQATV